MEAIAAIGLASNVLQFIDVGYKIVSTAMEMYGTGNEATRANKDIEFISLEMKRLSTCLSKGVPTSQAAENEQALSKLTGECLKWSDEMLTLLKYLKNRKPNSRIGAVRAAARNYKKKGEKKRLERGLDSCRRQLDLQLTSMSRSEILDEIRNLSKSTSLTNEDLTHLKNNIKSLQQSLQCATYINSTALEELRKALRASDQTLPQTKQELIINALKFEGMGNRFYDVETAHETTFEWLLGKQDDNRPDHHSPQRNAFKREARESFTNWLQYDSGIFHISGKPGAGKSTLMKFLCKNQLTGRYLENWSNDKTLVLAKSFFWRLGTDSQKSLNGLIRTLLYEVLSAAPSLVATAFPSIWAKADIYSNNQMSLGPEEIEQAFDNLLTNQVTFEERKIVFFIDGLDEYQGRHSELVKKFFSWTSSNQENLKICVASREWNEFTIGFAKCPKLRIHECTQEDITTFVSHRMKMCSEEFDPVNQDSLGFIVEKITSKAEGVFLWVRLALNATEGGILNGDSISDLEAKIDAFPSELNDLYQHLFDSIHVSDRRKVFETLRMASYMGPGRALRLLLFWFLNEAIIDPDFAIKMPITDASEEDLTKVLRTTQRQIYGRCKGFLDVYPLTPPGSKPGRTAAPLPSDGRVSFMHSTAYEFLNQSHIKQGIDHVVGHVDVFHRICQSFLASVKFANEAWYFHHHADNADSSFNRELGHLLQLVAGKEMASALDIGTRQRYTQFLKFLDELEIVTAERLSSRLTYKYVICYCAKFMTPVDYVEDGYVHTSPQTHIQSLTTVYLLHEYLRGKEMAYLKSMSSGSNTVIKDDTINDLALIFFSSHQSPLLTHYDRLCEMLELCFSRGVSPNYICQYEGLVFFDYMLLMFIFRAKRFYYDGDFINHYSQTIHPIRLLELCLRYRAKSQLRLRFGPIYQHKWSSEVLVKVEPDLGPAYRDKIDSVQDIESKFFTTSTSRIALFAKQRGWVLTLYDLLEVWAPDDYEMLQSLLDRNNDPDVASNLIAHSPKRSSFSEDKLKRPWRTIELREDLYCWENLNVIHDIKKDYERLRENL